jgi:cob(I)alamin adenosyltransferase
MPRLTKIYTRTGDQGEAALISGPRVPKDCLRVRALGTIDELNAHLGMTVSMGLAPMLAALLPEIQQGLLNLGADLAVPGGDPLHRLIPSVDATQVQMLESIIDDLNEELAPLESFVLPGGTPASGLLHVARTVCRRAECEVVALARAEGVGEHVLAYLNRLSDALFVMARYENHCRGAEERLWETPFSR